MYTLDLLVTQFLNKGRMNFHLGIHDGNILCVAEKEPLSKVAFFC